VNPSVEIHNNPMITCRFFTEIALNVLYELIAANCRSALFPTRYSFHGDCAERMLQAGLDLEIKQFLLTRRDLNEFVGRTGD